MLKTICVALSLFLATGIDTPPHDNNSIRNLYQVVNFDLYIPKLKISATHYEIKSPENLASNTDNILINYFDKDNNYVYGVRQMKNNSIIEKEIITLDVRNGSEKSKKILHKVELEPYGEKVDINGKTGWYVSYKGDLPTGGYLTWIQGDTYMEIDASDLDKSSLIEIAESMVSLPK